MKKLLLLLLLLPVVCIAKRDPCRQIKRVSNTEKKTRGYESPAMAHIMVVKQTKPTEYFGLNFNLSDDYEHFNRTGTEVEFEDGTVLKNETAIIACTQEPSTVAEGAFSTGGSHSGKYILRGFFRITDENVAKFTSSKIVSIHIADVSTKITTKDAKNIMIYVGCMKDRK